MKHSIKVIGDQAMVLLTDKIYVYDALLIKDDILKIIDQGITDVRMDLSGLVYIDSSGLGMLLTINKRLKKNNGVFVLAGLQGLPFELIKRTRLEKVFTIL